MKLQKLLSFATIILFTLVLTACGGTETDVANNDFFDIGDPSTAPTPDPTPIPSDPTPTPIETIPSPIVVPTPSPAEPPPATGNAANGKILYESSELSCAGCHGDDGQSTLFKPIDASADTYSHTQAPGVQYYLTNYLQLWMPPANIGACDSNCARDIEAYIRSWVVAEPQPSPTPVATPNPPLTPIPEPTAIPEPTPIAEPSPVVDAVVTLYQHCNFGGYSVPLALGTYDTTTLNALGVANNDVSSVSVGNGYQVTFYQNDDTTGNAITKTANDSCLIDDNFNDQTSSVVVSLASVAPSPEPTPSPEPSPEPTPTSEPLDCSDMQVFMQRPELNCTNSGCHSASPSQAAKIALTGTIDDMALRLGNVASVNSNCADEKVIDLDNPSNSLLLKIIDPNSGEQCATKMPIGGPPLSPEHFQCFEQWVDDIASLAVVPEPPVVDPFEATDGFSALNKVKNILHGGAVTNDEMDSAISFDGGLNQEALKAQIEQWMTTNEFETKFSAFLQLSLQQKQVNPDNNFINQFINLNGGVINANKLKANFQESFVKTAYRIFNNNGDFRNIARTRNWEVTTALLLALSHADHPRQFGVRNRIRNFEHLCGDATDEAGCDGIDDYADWKTVRLAQGTEAAAYSNTQGLAETLRAIPDGGELALLAPRVGFFTTPVFFQSWESNVGNQFRVTANQAMIVGLGLSFEAGDATPSGNLAALDEEHAGEDNPECYSCHRMLDPMTQVFDNYYDVNNSRALASPTNTAAAFAFHGGERVLNNIPNLGQAIFEHPNFAKGWVGKLCNWATSAPCDQSSSEFLRLVQFFKDSNHRLKPLVAELFASPLVTGAEYTDAFEENAGPGVVLNRRNHFCTTMKSRLDQYRESLGIGPSPFTDICNFRNAARSKAALLPQDEYSRGAIDLVQSVSLDPFVTTGYKQLCESVQNDMVNANAGVEGNNNFNRIFNSNQVDASIEAMVTYVMGLPPASDQHEEVKTVFRKVYDVNRNGNSCEEAGLDPVIANEDEVVCGLGRNNAQSLREVWKLACSSPSSIGMGF